MPRAKIYEVHMTATGEDYVPMVVMAPSYPEAEATAMIYARQMYPQAVMEVMAMKLISSCVVGVMPMIPNFSRQCPWGPGQMMALEGDLKDAVTDAVDELLAHADTEDDEETNWDGFDPGGLFGGEPLDPEEDLPF